jgi:hypothetical protein
MLDRLNENVDAWDSALGEIYLLLNAVRSIAQRCFYDPADRSEFYKALLLAYLGCLKFANLDQLAWAPMSKALAFLAAAYLMEPVAT